MLQSSVISASARLAEICAPGRDDTTRTSVPRIFLLLVFGKASPWKSESESLENGGLGYFAKREIDRLARAGKRH